MSAAPLPGLLLLVFLMAPPIASVPVRAQVAPSIDAHVARDSARIMDDLFFLASDGLGGRAVGSEGGAAARSLIVQSFLAAGLAPPPGAELVQPFEFSGRREPSVTVEGANVVVEVPGTDPTSGVLVVTAHYDHVGTRDGRVFNGADDNASGTAALLSVGRYLAHSPPRNTVLLVALDAEERGLRGAEAFLEEPWLDTGSIRINLNLDMISRSDSVLYAAGSYHTPALRPVLDDLAGEVPVVLRMGHDEPGIPGSEDWTNQSDHGAFHARGIPFVYFGVEDHPDYHTPGDDPERVGPGFYMNSIRSILMAIRVIDTRLDEIPRRQRQ